MNLKVINQSIQMSYDKEGNRYDLPIFVINKPVEYKNSNEVINFEIVNIDVNYYLN